MDGTGKKVAAILNPYTRPIQIWSNLPLHMTITTTQSCIVSAKWHTMHVKSLERDSDVRLEIQYFNIHDTLVYGCDKASMAWDSINFN